MTARSLAVLTAGLSQPSSTRLLADRLAASTQAALGTHGVEVSTDVVELRDHAADLTNSLLTASPARTSAGRSAASSLRTA